MEILNNKQIIAYSNNEIDPDELYTEIKEKLLSKTILNTDEKTSKLSEEEQELVIDALAANVEPKNIQNNEPEIKPEVEKKLEEKRGTSKIFNKLPTSDEMNLMQYLNLNLTQGCTKKFLKGDISCSHSELVQIKTTSAYGAQLVQITF